MLVAVRRGSPRAPAALLGCVVVLLAASPARSLTLAPLDLVEMTSRSTLVVRARCIDRQATDALGRIESLARFSVLELVLGEAVGEVVVRQLGGKSGDRETVVPGAPLSEPGDEALLFLEPGESGLLEVVGLAHGYLPVAVLPGGQAQVRATARLGAEFAGRSHWPLEMVLGRVRAIAAGPR